MAYDTSKAAANHLVRDLAVELAPRVRVNGVAPATVVAGSTMFPRERMTASLAKYSLPYQANETKEIHRFAHVPGPTPAGLCWDLTGLWQSILTGLRLSGAFAKRKAVEIWCKQRGMEYVVMTIG